VDQAASGIPASRSSPSSHPVPTHPSTTSAHSPQAAPAAQDRGTDRPLTLIPTVGTRTPSGPGSHLACSLPTLRPGSEASVVVKLR
jgi:hypothetical protein